MATPIDINVASFEDLKKIPNIGDKRATALIKLRDEKGPLTLEDVKQISSIPSTIWDPLVDNGDIVFGKTLAPTKDIPSMADKIQKLEHELKIQHRELVKKDIQISQTEKDIEKRAKENESNLQDLRESYENRLKKSELLLTESMHQLNLQHEDEIKQLKKERDEERSL